MAYPALVAIAPNSRVERGVHRSLRRRGLYSRRGRVGHRVRSVFHPRKCPLRAIMDGSATRTFRVEAEGAAATRAPPRPSAAWRTAPAAGTTAWGPDGTAPPTATRRRRWQF